MTDAERAKAFRQAQKEILKERTTLLRDTRAEVVLHLEDALAEIQIVLARAPADYQHWDVKNLQKEINLVLATYGERSAAVLSAASVKAWEIGVATVDKPLTAAGIGITANLSAIDTRQLMAMRAFMTDRIKDVGVAGARQINTELGLVMIGAQTPSDAITRVSDILGDPSRVRATTIVRTGLGSAYSVASQERLMQAGEKVPGLKKRWRRSGKIHSRLSHDAADGQIADKDKPFVIYGKNGPVEMMHPHDPTAPASETINCGCVALPFMEAWNVATPGKKPFSEEEIRLNPTKREIANAKTIAQIEKEAADKLAATKVSSVMEALESQIAASAVEQSFFVDRAGNTLLHKIGSEDSIKFTADELVQIRGSASLHNHPGVGSFSNTDVAFASAHKLVDLRVVDDAYNYSMRPPAGGWSAQRWEDEIEPLHDDIHAVVMGEFMDALLAGRMTEDAFAENLQHETWRRVNQQLDLRYLRKPRDNP